MSVARNLTRKLLGDHLLEGDLVPGEVVDLTVDQILIEDATGSMTALQFEALEAEDLSPPRGHVRRPQRRADRRQEHGRA